MPKELERQKQILLMELQGLQENVKQAKATLKRGDTPSALENIKGAGGSSCVNVYVEPTF